MTMKNTLKISLLLACGFAFTACQDSVSFDLPQTADNFPQSIMYNNKIDIVWVMDNSSSMQQHQARLSAQIPELVAKLNSLKLDYRMVVVTTSMGGTSPTGGRFIGSPTVMTASTSGLASLLGSRLQVGQDGSNNERGLESVETALSPGYLNREGAGFFRDDALLVVNVLSDEDDKSKSASSAVAYYTNFFDSIKHPWSDGTRSWVLNFIGVLSLSSQCSTFNDYAEPGLTFIDLAKASGGVTESICSNSLTDAVSSMRSRIVQILTDFKLSKVPNVSTIVVKLNGVVVPRSNVNGWDYIASGNLVRFYGTAVPSADSAINVEFKPAAAN